MKERYILQVFFENQQAAFTVAEKVSREFGLIVDVLHKKEIATIHPPIKVENPICEHCGQPSMSHHSDCSHG
jgi:hypothetical protein